MTKYFVKGQSIFLDKNNFKASGGEGEIYIINNIAYKIYTDTNNACPEKKITELSVLDNDNIIKPVDIIYDVKNKNVGYTMRAITSSYSFCELFTKTFKSINGITIDLICNLILKFKAIIECIHSKNIIVVDLNELNFLISKDFDSIYAIDVDSYQTPSFKAKMIMPSIRDWHVKQNDFTKLSDWYSFAILSFQLFTGLHPYKGKYSKGSNDLESRMKNNISVFNPNVNYPKICDINIIPSSYKEWFKRVFESEERLPPPQSFNLIIENVQFTVKNEIIDNLNLNIEFLFEVDSSFLFIKNDVLFYKDFFNYENKSYETGNKQCEVLFDLNVIITHDGTHLYVYNKDEYPDIIIYSIECEKLLKISDEIYYKIDNKIYKLITKKLQSNYLFSSELKLEVLNSIQYYENIIIQNIFGTWYANILFENGSKFIKLPINDRVINAKLVNNVIILITVSNTGKYNRNIIKFDGNYENYDFSATETCLTDCEFVIVNNFIIFINENDEIESISSIPNKNKKAVIKNSFIDSKCRLFVYKNKLVVVKNNKLYKISTKT